MKIGIIAAMPQELKILVEALENGEKHLRLGKVYYTGSIGRHEVVLVESGIGKVMSAMISKWKPLSIRVLQVPLPQEWLLGISSLRTNWPIMMWM